MHNGKRKCQCIIFGLSKTVLLDGILKLRGSFDLDGAINTQLSDMETYDFAWKMIIKKRSMRL